jgi:hypothetical protein
MTMVMNPGFASGQASGGVDSDSGAAQPAMSSIVESTIVVR